MTSHDDTHEVEIIEATFEDIQAGIDEIYAKYPYLKDRVRTSDCSCSEWQDVRDEYGIDAGNAWENLETLKWLLGDA